jgi:hypothetical protein
MDLRHAGLLLLLILAALTSGCATVMNGGGTSVVNITSNPVGASYEISDGRGVVVRTGITPSVAALKGSRGYGSRALYQVRFRKDGYQDSTLSLVPRRNAWYWGNLLFGGIPGGLFVDPFTGAMYRMPRQINGDLKPEVSVAQQPADSPQTNPGAAHDAIRKQRLSELSATPGLSYEEYKRRYQMIMEQ